MDDRQQSRGPTRRQLLLWAGAILAVLVGAVILFAAGYRWKWTGFTGRTLWDWLKFLGAVLVPVFIAYFGHRISSLQYLGQREAEENRAQDEALRSYLDHTGQLLRDRWSDVSGITYYPMGDGYIKRREEILQTVIEGVTD